MIRGRDRKLKNKSTDERKRVKGFTKEATQYKTLT